MEWQPIETAPSETELIVLVDGHLATGWLSGGKWYDSEDGDYLSGTPTHYMIVKPPSGQAQARD